MYDTMIPSRWGLSCSPENGMARCQFYSTGILPCVVDCSNESIVERVPTVTQAVQSVVMLK